jgi:hypothetical protein
LGFRASFEQVTPLHDGLGAKGGHLRSATLDGGAYNFSIIKPVYSKVAEFPEESPGLPSEPYVLGWEDEISASANGFSASSWLRQQVLKSDYDETDYDETFTGPNGVVQTIRENNHQGSNLPFRMDRLIEAVETGNSWGYPR